MELIQQLKEYINPEFLIKLGGYPGLALIIFLETGALVFFLPGDSLLVTAGLFAAKGDLNIAYLNLLLIPMAIMGDALSYFIGARSGPALFNKPDAKLLKPKYMQAAKDFYEKHGGKAIIIARFMPVVRTFVPVVAGIAQMSYRRFALFNIIGAASWILSMSLLGFVLGNIIPDIGKHIEKVIIVIVFLSILPGIIGWFRRDKGVSSSAT